MKFRWWKTREEKDRERFFQFHGTYGTIEIITQEWELHQSLLSSHRDFIRAVCRDMPPIERIKAEMIMRRELKKYEEQQILHGNY